MQKITDFAQYIRDRHVVDHAGCWLWTGAVDKDGYGYALQRGAHRISFEGFRGAIPSHLQIDHLCRIKLCVNPDHLELVTAEENIKRRGPTRFPGTHCKYGHEFTAENTYVWPKGKWLARTCMTCNRLRQRAIKRGVPFLSKEASL